jgi:hypothetical protein
VENFLVNHRRCVDHYHPGREQISSPPLAARATFAARADIGVSGKKLANRFARSLSTLAGNDAQETRFRSRTAP